MIRWCKTHGKRAWPNKCDSDFACIAVDAVVLVGEPCPNCDGTGWITGNMPQPISGAQRKSCESCGGSGTTVDITGTRVFDKVQERWGVDGWRKESLVSVVMAVLDALAEGEQT